MHDHLLENLQKKDRRSLAQLLTRVSDPAQRLFIAQGLETISGKLAHVVAITGSAGVGKSTLIGKLAEKIRAAGSTVAILACDPQSPLTGGALLGDRLRMPGQPDEGLFIRSLATPGGGTVTEALDVQIRLLECFGFDWVIIETVGAGQGDTSVCNLVDGVVLLLQAEAGDEVQWEKAGLVEVANVLVIHKADLPGSERVQGQVLGMLSLGPGPVPPVVCVSSRSGQGLEELLQILKNLPSRRHPRKTASHLLKIIHQELEYRLKQVEKTNRAELDKLLQLWQIGQMDSRKASEQLLELLVVKK